MTDDHYDENKSLQHTAQELNDRRFDNFGVFGENLSKASDLVRANRVVHLKSTGTDVFNQCFIVHPCMNN